MLPHYFDMLNSNNMKI